MEIEYKGANCVVISSKKVTIVVDPVLEALNGKTIAVKDAIQLATKASLASDAVGRLRVDGPGEYEVANVSIKGIAARAHIEDKTTKNATMYSIDMEDIRIGITGHVAADVTEEQLEEMGTVDILILPVGGYGYTLEPHEAVALVRRIAPKVVAPTHFDDGKGAYQVAQGDLTPFLKELSAHHEIVARYKPKATALPEVLTVMQIER
ncbi:MAG TPA: MBL fold metallo-hydrolase [Candidatus Saccharimonadales bacterium]